MLAAQKPAVVQPPSVASLAAVRLPVSFRVCSKSQITMQERFSRRNVSADVAAMGQIVGSYDQERLIVSGSDFRQQKELTKLAKGYHWYETMLILRRDMTDDERDRELAKFEAFLNKQQCQNINALVRSASRLAYTIKGSGEGIYVVYTYVARRQTAQAVQNVLANPEVGSEGNIIRYRTFCKF